MNGETAYQFMFICELKNKTVGDHHFHNHVTDPAPPGLQKSSSNISNRNIVLPGQTSTEDVTYVFDSKKKLTLKQNNEPFKNNWRD